MKAPKLDILDLPELDRVEGAPHPRETAQVFGHAGPQAGFLEAFNAGRLHHGWLISGPRGVGKATLAWKLARFLLATPEEGGMFAPPAPQTLDIPSGHPILARTRALSEPRLSLVRRGLNEKEDAMARDILVKEIRKLKSSLSLSSADGGRRVAIVDAADEMNPNAANALLKLLEEPPAKVTLLLISHQPFRLLPTIRSRCRELRLGPLSADDMALALHHAGHDPEDPAALAELSGGSVGEAIRILGQDGLSLYRDIVGLMDTLPRLNRPAALALSERSRGAEAQFDLILYFLDLLLSRLARAGITRETPPEAAPGEAALIARLVPTTQAARVWADLAQSLGARARRGRAVNLDPAALLMDMLLKIDETAAQLALR